MESGERAPSPRNLARPDSVKTMELVRLTVVPNEPEAEIVCGMLRVNGVMCSFRKTDIAAGAWTEGFARGGPVEILVQADDFAEARKLLSADSGQA